MNVRWAVEIAGTGIYVPDQVLTNHDFAQRLDTSDEWIVQRTGIRVRHIVSPEQATLNLSAAASRAALEAAKVSPDELDLIIHATVTPEHPLPSTACELQAELGCSWIPAFDINAACSGFVYALVTAAQFIGCGLYKNIRAGFGQIFFGPGPQHLIRFATCLLLGHADAPLLSSL